MVRKAEYYTEPTRDTQKRCLEPELGDTGPVYAEPFAVSKHPTQLTSKPKKITDLPLPPMPSTVQPPPLPKSRPLANPIYDSPKNCETESDTASTSKSANASEPKRQHKNNPLYNTDNTAAGPSKNKQQKPAPAQRGKKFKINPLYNYTGKT